MTPRGGVDRVDGVGPDGELRVRVRAAPADGAANAAVVRTIAAGCGVAPGRVAIIRGVNARLKEVAIADTSPEQLRTRWPGLLLTSTG